MTELKTGLMEQSYNQTDLKRMSRSIKLISKRKIKIIDTIIIVILKLLEDGDCAQFSRAVTDHK